MFLRNCRLCADFSIISVRVDVGNTPTTRMPYGAHSPAKDRLRIKPALGTGVGCPQRPTNVVNMAADIDDTSLDAAPGTGDDHHPAVESKSRNLLGEIRVQCFSDQSCAAAPCVRLPSPSGVCG